MRRSFPHNSPLILTSIFVFFAIAGDANIVKTRFVPSQICGTIHDLKGNNCTTPKNAWSNLKCALECGKNQSCLGIVFDEKKMCNFLHLCDYASDNMNCDQVNIANVTKVTRKECQHDGKFTRTRNLVCECNEGLVGAFCQRRAKTCQELIGYGYEIGQTYDVPLDTSLGLFKTVCSLNSDFVVTGLFSNSGKRWKLRSWFDYKKGYFDKASDYWVGLENMHSWTNTNDSYFVRWTLYYSETRPGNDNYKTSDSLYYYGFRVGNESVGYALRYDECRRKSNETRGPVETPMEDCLDGSQDIPFSAWDHDSDLDIDINCAELAGAGWWFKSCMPSAMCNPLGKSVAKLPPPKKPSHIALKGLDMIYSEYGQKLRKLEVELIVVIDRT